MVNVNRLKGKIVENGMNIGDLAEKIGVDRATMYRKIKSRGESISIGEANKIIDVLGLSIDEANSIFFDRGVAQMRISDGAEKEVV